MKKLTALMLSILIVLSAATSLVGATEAAAPAWTTQAPDLIITEFCPDSQGSGDAGYSGNQDPFEWFEIYNNSDVTLNLYDYCVTYNGNTPSNKMYENAIVELTPFKPGDFWEDDTKENTQKGWAKDDKPAGDFSNKPQNPESFFIEPGECVVVWCLYYEAYLAAFNEGKGMSMADFRKFWNLPDSVKVICFDGNSAKDYGGSDKNFNLKNSGCGSYGIAKYSEALNEACNKKGTVTEKDETGKYGYKNIYDEKTYREFEDLVSWINMDFDSWGLSKAQANMTINFTLDANGYGAQLLTSLSGVEHAYDMRRGIVCTSFSEPTPGKLIDVQKMTLPDYKLKAGETLQLPSVEEAEYMPYDIWYKEGHVLTELKINGTSCKPGSTYTATAAGTITVEPVFEVEQTTEKPETSKKPTDDGTKKPADEKTDKAPVGTAATPQTSTVTEEKKKGCGSSVAYAAVALVAIFGTAVVFKRK